MKIVSLISDTDKITSLELFRIAVTQAPEGARLDEQRRRWRLLDAFDALTPDATSLKLEDADWEHLKRLIEQYPWKLSSLDMRPIINGLFDAQAPAACRGLRDQEGQCSGT